MTATLEPLAFADPHLLRDRAYVDGGWIAADSGATSAVSNSAADVFIGHVRTWAPPRPGGRSPPALPAWRAHCQGT